MANQPPSQEQLQELARQNAQFMARVWSDESFKQRLISDPKGVLWEQGVSVPEGVELRVVENSDRVVHLVLPPKPTDELNDEQLETVAGGNCLGTFATGGSLGTAGSLSCPASTVGTLGSVGSIGTLAPSIPR